MLALIENPSFFVILIGLNLPLFVLIGRRLFENGEAWKAALLDAFRVDHLVPFHGFKNPWPGGKFWLFFLGCFVLVAIEYAVLESIVERFFVGF